MSYIIETPEQELQFLIGTLLWENISMKHTIEKLNKEQQKPTTAKDDPRESTGP